jgi:nucleotide-binding universal stress UspA family protein
MYSKILVALDGSKTAEHILPYARLLAKKLHLSAELVQVIDSDKLMPDNVDPEQESRVATKKKNIEEYLNSTAGSFPDRSSFTVKVGHPAEIIVDQAAAAPETLVAMTTHGRSGIHRWFLGSVADKVLHAARNPLLLIRANETGAPSGPELRSILVPLDGSELAESVLPHVVELAGKLDVEVLLVRIFNLPNLYSDEMYVLDERTWELIRDEAQQYLNGKVRELKAKGLPHVKSVLLEGFAADRIITFAREMPGILIAICTHGRSGVRRWVLGSVTDRVVRHSGDPVLIIRAPGAA